jgi:hypothetical protein
MCGLQEQHAEQQSEQQPEQHPVQLQSDRHESTQVEQAFDALQNSFIVAHS